MKTFLIISQSVYAFCMIAWLLVWMMSFMVFDSGVYFWNTILFITISMYTERLLKRSVLRSPLYEKGYD